MNFNRVSLLLLIFLLAISITALIPVQRVAATTNLWFTSWETGIKVGTFQWYTSDVYAQGAYSTITVYVGYGDGSSQTWNIAGSPVFCNGYPQCYQYVIQWTHMWYVAGTYNVLINIEQPGTEVWTGMIEPVTVYYASTGGGGMCCPHPI